MMAPRTTIEKRELVLKHFKDGLSQRKIAQIVDLSRSTVQHIIERFVHENRVENKGRRAPNKIFNERDSTWLVRQVKENPTTSAPKLANMAEKYLGKPCHPETVRRVLRDANLNGRIARKKPFINSKNRNKRLQFYREHLNKGQDFWNTVIFADETKVNLFGPDGRPFVWREPISELQPKNLKSTIKHGGGNVLVWGCMGAFGVGKLVFIEDTMNKYTYLKILQENLAQSAEKLQIVDNFRFYQDNDPKHKSALVQSWLIWKCPHTVQTPAQSPDLNPIENLWSILKTNIKKHNIQNKTDLKKALQEEWDQITAEYTKKLVDSMPRRLQAVIDNKGYPTKY